MNKKRLVIAMTGATGAIYGVRMLQILKDLPDWESHLVISSAGLVNLKYELDMDRATLHQLADVTHGINDIASCIASGSFKTEGVVVAPCSMRTLAAIAHGLGDNLLTRAADVTLKERRRLVLLTRESPLHLGHLRNMAAVTEMGAICCPPMPAFYQRPSTVDEIVDHSVARVLDLLGLSHALSPRWQGLPAHP